jgi:hypothetical protein
MKGIKTLCNIKVNKQITIHLKTKGGWIFTLFCSKIEKTFLALPMQQKMLTLVKEWGSYELFHVKGFMFHGKLTKIV